MRNLRFSLFTFRYGEYGAENMEMLPFPDLVMLNSENNRRFLRQEDDYVNLYTGTLDGVIFILEGRKVLHYGFYKDENYALQYG
jgi:hypothetical protein